MPGIQDEKWKRCGIQYLPDCGIYACQLGNLVKRYLTSPMYGPYRL